MEKKEKELLIWILGMAGVFLLVLYSPIGSPSLYLKNQYIDENQGVSFLGSITNAPKNETTNWNNNLVIPGSSVNFGTSLETDNSSIGSEVPTYTSSNLNKAKYAVDGNSDTNIGLNDANYFVQTSMYNNDEKKSHAGYSNQGLLSYSAQNKPESATDNTTKAGNLYMSLDLSLFGESSSNKQTVEYAPNQGGMDPGGQPLGEIIPVGDGWLILLAMAILYAKIRI